MDEEDKDYIMQETGMSLNQRIFFSLANNNKNYLECTELMYRIVVYVLGKLNGDISFAYISSDVAILERRTSVLAVDQSSLEWYSELTALSPVMRYTLTAESLAVS